MLAHIYVIVKSHYEEVIVVITRVRGRAKDECKNNDNLLVQWDLTGFYPIVLMCITLCNKWPPEDNHVIASLVSILFTLVLGMMDFTCCDVSKGQRDKHMYETVVYK